MLIYDKGFPIKGEVFSEGIGGGKRTLPLQHFDSRKLMLIRDFCKRFFDF